MLNMISCYNAEYVEPSVTTPTAVTSVTPVHTTTVTSARLEFIRFITLPPRVVVEDGKMICIFRAASVDHFGISWLPI